MTTMDDPTHPDEGGDVVTDDTTVGELQKWLADHHVTLRFRLVPIFPLAPVASLTKKINEAISLRRHYLTFKRNRT
jgi:hypothetical protein